MRHKHQTRRAPRRRSGSRDRCPRQTCLQTAPAGANLSPRLLFLNSHSARPPPLPPQPQSKAAIPLRAQPSPPRHSPGPEPPVPVRAQPPPSSRARTHGGGEAGPSAGHVPARLPREKPTQGAAPGPRGSTGRGRQRSRSGTPLEGAGEGARSSTHLGHEPRAGRRAGPPVTGETAAPRRAGARLRLRPRQRQGRALGRTLPGSASGARHDRLPGQRPGSSGAGGAVVLAPAPAVAPAPPGRRGSRGAAPGAARGPAEGGGREACLTGSSGLKKKKH